MQYMAHTVLCSTSLSQRVLVNHRLPSSPLVPRPSSLVRRPTRCRSEARVMESSVDRRSSIVDRCSVLISSAAQQSSSPLSLVEMVTVGAISLMCAESDLTRPPRRRGDAKSIAPSSTSLAP